jgi:type I restriction enzyme S subunit
MSKPLVPEIRFGGYSEPWEQHLFGDITTSYSGGTPQVGVKDYYGGNIPFIRSGEIHQNTTELFITEKGYNESSAAMVEKGDILLALYGATSGEVAISQIDGAINQAILAVKPYTGYSANVITHWLERNKKDLLNTYLQGGQGNLSGSIVKSFLLTIPQDFKEQNEIGEWFKRLDDMVANAEKEVTRLEKMKIASLQKMFPHPGQTTPEVRFGGYSDRWQNQLARDIFISVNERNRPDLPVLSAFQDLRGMFPRSLSNYNIYHDKINETGYKVVHPGQFVIHLRSFQGGFAHSKYKGIVSPAYTVFKFKNEDEHDDIYWKYVFMSFDFIESLKTITYGIRDGRSINFEEFGDMSFAVPSKSEQKAIGNFLLNLDNLITKKRNRIVKLRNIKKACLEKMFVNNTTEQ